MDDLPDLQSQIVRAVSGHAEYQFARWDFQRPPTAR